MKQVGLEGCRIGQTKVFVKYWYLEKLKRELVRVHRAAVVLQKSKCRSPAGMLSLLACFWLLQILANLLKVRVVLFSYCCCCSHFVVMFSCCYGLLLLLFSFCCDTVAVVFMLL